MSLEHMGHLEKRKQEDLKRINWNNENELRENQVGITYKDGRWIVFATDERASIVETSIAVFNSEGEAIEKLIHKARNSKILFG